MSDWRLDMRPAHFRGVRFYVRKTETVHETKTAVNDFPGRSTPEASTEVIFLGAPSRTFNVDAYLVGDDYLDRQAALEAALSEQSYGRLVHPYRGERTVAIIGKFVTTEQPSEGGKARISFTCRDVTDSVGLTDRIDTEALAERDLDLAISALADDFDASFTETTDGLSDIYQGEAKSIWEQATEALREANTEIASKISGLDDFASQVNAAAFSVEQLVRAPGAAAAALMRAGQSIATIPDRIATALEQTAGTVRTAVDEVIDSLRRSFFADAFARPNPFAVETANTIAEEQIARGSALIVRSTGILAAARAAVTLPFVSRERAIELRDELSLELDGLIAAGSAGAGTSGGAIAYQRLRAVKVSMARHLETIAAALPDLATETITEDESALAMAWRLYGDARREAEIVARNAPSHPHRLEAGRSYEVIR